MSERINVIVLSDHETFYKGEVDFTYQCLRIFFDKKLHPYIKDDQLIPTKAILVPYAGVKFISDN